MGDLEGQFVRLSVGAICSMAWTPSPCGREQVLEDPGAWEGMLLSRHWTCLCSGPFDSLETPGAPVVLIWSKLVTCIHKLERGDA